MSREPIVHLASPQNPHRTACGDNIMLRSFVVAALAQVTCKRCRRVIESWERRGA